jgi:hypothetical protein
LKVLKHFWRLKNEAMGSSFWMYLFTVVYFNWIGVLGDEEIGRSYDIYAQ